MHLKFKHPQSIFYILIYYELLHEDSRKTIKIADTIWFENKIISDSVPTLTEIPSIQSYLRVSRNFNRNLFEFFMDFYLKIQTKSLKQQN